MALPFSHQFPTGPFGNRVPKAQQQIIIQGSKPFCGGESGWWHQIQGNKKGLQLLANPWFYCVVPKGIWTPVAGVKGGWQGFGNNPKTTETTINIDIALKR